MSKGWFYRPVPGVSLASPRRLANKLAPILPGIAQSFLWDVDNSSGYCVFSEDGRTFLQDDNEPGNFATAVATLRSETSFYAELELTTLTGGGTHPDIGFGITNDQSFALGGSTEYLGQFLNSAMYWLYDQSNFTCDFLAASTITMVDGAVEGMIIMFYVDPAAGKAWIGRDGEWFGDPVAGTDPWLTWTYGGQVWTIGATLNGNNHGTITIRERTVYDPPYFPPDDVDSLLQENGDQLLQENGDLILLEQQSGGGGDGDYFREDGTPLMREDDTPYMRET